MTDNNMLDEYPIRRISPVDGMAVTAAVWEEAHSYHQAKLRFHVHYSHGTGVLHGLEVIASDPPDTAVYIRPGIAADERGDAIVLFDPLAYDFSANAADGTLYLLFSYGESRPRAAGGDDGGPYYVNSEFTIEAVAELPATPHVELARINRLGRDAPITDAIDPLHPGRNEIDLRYRRGLRRPAQPNVGMAVAYVGGDASRDERHRLGVDRLAHTVNYGGSLQVAVDHAVQLGNRLPDYTLLYLVAMGSFQLSADEMNAIYSLLQMGGTLLFESAGGEPAADSAFEDMMATYGIRVADLRPDDSLLTHPHVFAVPPRGGDGQGPPNIKLGEGVIYSGEDYGVLWRGERRGALVSRAELRSAYEWGENILHYAARRRKEIRGA